ncbi:MAG: ABC transporter ATP-binding protein [Bacteroidales bacterium]|jgi:NitT/TauT family transport system ATP-binding protein|nr:ABC transporter ATP-binding protein [Bacteroidales bacterium]
MIDIKNVSVDFRQQKKQFTALRNVSLSIAEGEFICLLGASGCGKTTLLNAIAGFEKISSGSIKIAGEEVRKPDSHNTFLFQNYGLLPWRTVQHNVELGLENNIRNREERRKIAYKYLRLVGLEEFKDRHPAQLSGGMQQRVAIARALAVNPKILYMDEPLGALDVITRANLQDEIIRIWREFRKTIIFVTHDIEEAVYLADRVVIMAPNPGRIKAVLPINLGRGRDRTSAEFQQLRDKVYEIFEMKNFGEAEYYL